ncbi:MAG: sigma-70 family RNA polymerase sigma factor [Armatimonadota bacterium]|nr:sigma-70 family RNA polymerase sigma factor [bacterium]
MSISDIDFVERAKSGDCSAFDSLVGMHQERVFALAYRILGNADDAADVQQDTFLRAWRFLHKFRGGCLFSTWLYRITVNLCLSRKACKMPDAVPLDEDQTASANAARVDALATSLTVRRALAEVPANHRALIVLREIEGRPFEEIAAILGCSVGSARVRSCKARNLLREKLRTYMEDETL